MTLMHNAYDTFETRICILQILHEQDATVRDIAETLYEQPSKKDYRYVYDNIVWLKEGGFVEQVYDAYWGTYKYAITQYGRQYS